MARGRARWSVSTGSERCPACGGDPVDSTPQGFRRWLTHGGRGGPTLTCAEGHSWQAGSYSTMTAGPRSKIGRLLGLPVQLFRMVRHHRHMEPVPVTYLMAAGVGLALGIAVDLFAGVPWWLVTGGFVALVWLFFMSTAFWGPHRLRLGDIARVTSPGRARAKEHQALEKAIRSGELQAYAVAAWRGRGSLGGWGTDSRGRRSITLRFTDPQNERRWLEVETISGDQPAGPRRHALADNLLSRVIDPPTFTNIDELRGWHMGRRREQEELAQALIWQPGHLAVDGVEVRAETIAFDDGIAAHAAHDDVSLELIARGVDPQTLELARVPSLKPYIEDMSHHH